MHDYGDLCFNDNYRNKKENEQYKNDFFLHKFS